MICIIHLLTLPVRRLPQTKKILLHGEALHCLMYKESVHPKRFLVRMDWRYSSIMSAVLLFAVKDLIYCILSIKTGYLLFFSFISPFKNPPDNRLGLPFPVNFFEIGIPEKHVYDPAEVWTFVVLISPAWCHSWIEQISPSVYSFRFSFLSRINPGCKPFTFVNSFFI